MIYIRTDANNTIATGHIMRCISIAKELELLGEKVTFLVSDEDSLPLITEQGLPFHCLHTTWDHLDNQKEYDALASILNSGDKIIIDTYSITSTYVAYLKTLVKVICFDDMCKERYDADVIINYNLFYKRFPYTELYGQSTTKLLVGGQYVPLRRQFCDELKKAPNESKEGTHILLICGGGDPLHMIYSYLHWLTTCDKSLLSAVNWHIVLGRYNPMYSDILKLVQAYPNITIHQNVQNMATLMKQCDICVSAASTILYECCVMKLPTIFFIVADDQQYDADVFSADNTMLYAGDYRSNPLEVHEQIGEHIKLLLGNNAMLNEMKEKMKIIDGLGSERIAKEIHFL